MVLVPGMMFTIEPMINQGSPEFYVDEDNGWTVYTDDDGLSAQIEYMVLIKEDGVEVLRNNTENLSQATPFFAYSDIKKDYRKGQFLFR